MYECPCGRVQALTLTCQRVATPCTYMNKELPAATSNLPGDLSTTPSPEANPTSPGTPLESHLVKEQQAASNTSQEQSNRTPSAEAEPPEVVASDEQGESHPPRPEDSAAQQARLLLPPLARPVTAPQGNPGASAGAVEASPLAASVPPVPGLAEAVDTSAYATRFSPLVSQPPRAWSSGSASRSATVGSAEMADRQVPSTFPGDECISLRGRMVCLGLWA